MYSFDYMSTFSGRRRSTLLRYSVPRLSFTLAPHLGASRENDCRGRHNWWPRPYDTPEDGRVEIRSVGGAHCAEQCDNGLQPLWRRSGRRAAPGLAGRGGAPPRGPGCAWRRLCWFFVRWRSGARTHSFRDVFLRRYARRLRPLCVLFRRRGALWARLAMGCGICGPAPRRLALFHDTSSSIAEHRLASLSTG